MVVCDSNRPAIEQSARQRALPIAVVRALLVNYDASAADLQRVVIVPPANMVQAAWSEVRPGVVVRPAEHRGAFDRPIVAGRAFHRADRSPANLREALQHTFRIGGETWGDRCTCSGEICLRFEDQKVLKSTLLCAFLSASVTACP